MSDLTKKDISHEIWREYEIALGYADDWGLPAMRIYRIDNPVTLYTRPGGTTHRIVDRDGITHCLPAVGYHGCAIRWYNGEGNDPCKF